MASVPALHQLWMEGYEVSVFLQRCYVDGEDCRDWLSTGPPFDEIMEHVLYL